MKLTICYIQHRSNVLIGDVKYALAKAIAIPSIILLAMSSNGMADEMISKRLGTARLFTNDYLGDGHDRWRTGSYSIALLESTPSKQGDQSFVEKRLRFDMFSPWQRQSASSADRPYGLMTSIGYFKHRHHGSGLSHTGLEILSLIHI